MRIFLIVLVAITLGGCTAMMVGGGGSYQSDRDERAASSAAADSSITSKIRAAYAADTTLGALAIGVRTRAGTVTLTGTVDSYTSRDSAVRIARSTSGVSVVDSQLLVESK